jgi:hypothetical protein
MPTANEQWILKKRPVDRLKPSDLELRASDLPPLKDGECLVKVRYLAMDPATRGWMGETGGYVDPLPLGGPVMGVTVSEVIESRNSAIRPGMIVAGVGPWAKFIIVGPKGISPVRSGDLGVLAPMDVSTGHDLPVYLHAMGTSGGTAYYGLIEVAAMKPGDKVLVSAAGGSVGSLACQIAKLKGASKVVGIAGGADKCRQTKELYGCDAVIDYKAQGSMSAKIKAEFPTGLDVYFDNVGGEILEAALDNLSKNARIAICGMISQYNTPDERGIRNLWNLLVHEARIEGFLVSSWFGSPACEAAFREIDGWLKKGAMNATLDIRNMFGEIASAYNLLFTGGNLGRLVVRVPD